MLYFFESCITKEIAFGNCFSLMDMDQEGFADQHHPMNLLNNLDFFTFGGQYRSLQNKRLNLDGKNTAPVDNIGALSTGFSTSQVVPDFFHQQ